MTQVNGQANGTPASSSSAVVALTAQQIEIERLKKQIAELEKQRRDETRKSKAPTCKVGDKGGIVVSGLDSKFPTTLYANQMMKLLKAADSIRAFMLAHFDELAFKSTEVAAEVDTWLGRTPEGGLKS